MKTLSHLEKPCASSLLILHALVIPSSWRAGSSSSSNVSTGARQKRRFGFRMFVFWRITTKIRRDWHSVEVLISIMVKQQTVGSGFKNVS